MMPMGWLWTLGAALAQDAPPVAPEPEVPAEPAPVEGEQPEAPEAPAEPAEPAEPVPAEPQADVEITVWGRLAIQQARDEVVDQIEELGYREVRRRNGETMFRGRYAKVTFFDDGRLQIGRVVAGLAPPPREVTEPPPRPGLPQRTAPMETGAGPWFWALPSKAKIDPLREEILQATRDEVQAYVEVMRRTALEEMLQGLPDRLDRLWTEGAPLSGQGAPIEGMDARREAGLAFWASRTDTVEGRRAAEVVESWLSAVVQASEHPITAEERAKFEAQAPPGRTLPE
jgi:hypothetical protein